MMMPSGMAIAALAALLALLLNGVRIPGARSDSRESGFRFALFCSWLRWRF
jgi:hypothetical protein